MGVLLLGMSVWCWCKPPLDYTDSERRVLAQFPDTSTASLLSGKFSSDFETYAADQFPLRDNFRMLHSAANLHLFRKLDTNGLYTTGGYLVKQEYPLHPAMLEHAAERFQFLYDSYLTDKAVYFALVPDKNIFLGESAGRLSLDYNAVAEAMQEKMAYAQYIDLFPLLEASDYYRTDTHWRQECLLDAAAHLAKEMGVTVTADYTEQSLDTPFYGVYVGQLALPVKPDTLTYLTSPTLEGCVVTNYDTGLPVPTAVYDFEKAAGKDAYELFLSGNSALITLENPHAAEERELIVFRDSFGSSLVPLLAEGYSKITLVDIRYVQSSMLGHLVDFEAADDVLFLYSTLVLNNSLALK